MPSLMLLETMAEPGFVQVVAMGLITVFVVLICLIVIIKIMGSILAGTNAAPTPAAAPAPRAAAPAAAAPAAPAAASVNKQQLVAAISVAIAEEMGSSVEHIRIHSIRKL